MNDFDDDVDDEYDILKEKSLYFIDDGVLENLTDSALFYPCSGNDLLTPIELFSPYVNDFWFVDKGYFSSGNQDTRYFGLDLPASQHEPLLENDSDYQLIGKPIIEGPEDCPRRYPFNFKLLAEDDFDDQLIEKTVIEASEDYARYPRNIEPCTLTETYLHLPSQRTIRIHKRRGYGFSMFKEEIESIGVFFYRGDSAGEGGSGDLWLQQEHIIDVCEKLINYGLIVLDGSDGSTDKKSLHSNYHGFWKWRNTNFYSPEDIKLSCESFSDRQRRQFSCVGYAGKRYGNTLMWQVSK